MIKQLKYLKLDLNTNLFQILYIYLFYPSNTYIRLGTLGLRVLAFSRVFQYTDILMIFVFTISK